jgi:hypothetical protein
MSNPTPHYGVSEDKIVETSSESVKMFKISEGRLSSEPKTASNPLKAASFTVGNISLPSLNFKEEKSQQINPQPDITRVLTEMLEHASLAIEFNERLQDVIKV